MEAARKIAKALLVGERQNGDRFEIFLEIGLPHLYNQVDDEGDEWMCSVSMSPLVPKSHDVHGDGSFQALCLAISLAYQFLSRFMEDGGKLFFPTGEEVDSRTLNAVFGR